MMVSAVGCMLTGMILEDAWSVGVARMTAVGRRCMSKALGVVFFA